MFAGLKKRVQERTVSIPSEVPNVRVSCTIREWIDPAQKERDNPDRVIQMVPTTLPPPINNAGQTGTSSIDSNCVELDSTVHEEEIPLEDPAPKGAIIGRPSSFTGAQKYYEFEDTVQSET